MSKTNVSRTLIQDKTRLQLERTIRAALDGCRMYVKASCDTALRSSAITEQDRNNALAWRGVAERFERDQERCASGSVAACDAAIASPADANERASLKRLRDSAAGVLTPVTELLA